LQSKYLSSKCNTTSCLSTIVISTWNPLTSEKFYREPILDDDYILVRESCLEGLASNFIEAYKINDYLQISSVCNIEYGNSWIDFDEIERRAFEIAVNKFNIERQKKQKEEEEKLMKNFTSIQPHKSGFTDMPMPSLSFK